MKLLGLLTILMVSLLPMASASEPPLPTECLQIDGHKFTVEIAKTPEQQQRGLQHRKHLKADKGMIFLFSPPSQQAFWMKDCDIPLDLLYFSNNQLVHYVDSAPPCYMQAKDCPVYASEEPIDSVVELKAGTRQKLGFKTGSELKLCP